jgi:hypothetical protein
VWKYKPKVQATIDSVVAQLDLEEKPTIGFHIRGGDKLIEDSNGCALALLPERPWPQHAGATGCQQGVTHARGAGTAPPRWRTTTSRRSPRRRGGRLRRGRRARAGCPATRRGLA